MYPFLPFISMQPKLSLLICTINDRIENVPALLLSQREDVCYIVSFQFTAVQFLEMVPSILKERPDVTILPISGIGLSYNRNNALRHCTTELALIVDDDARYTSQQLDMVIRYFSTHPDVDIACFQAIDNNEEPIKSYPTTAFDYSHRPSGSYFSSWEIALRTDAPLPSFDPRFGLGAGYLSCGEEEVFLHQAYRQGARICYEPQVLCSIPSRQTTGAHFSDDVRVRRSKGATLYMMYGFLGALIRITNFALSLPWKLRWKFWRDMLDGLLYIFSTPLNEGGADDIPLDFQPIDFRKLP